MKAFSHRSGGSQEKAGGQIASWRVLGGPVQGKLEIENLYRNLEEQLSRYVQKADIYT